MSGHVCVCVSIILVADSNSSIAVGKYMYEVGDTTPGSLEFYDLVVSEQNVCGRTQGFDEKALYLVTLNLHHISRSQPFREL